MSASQHIMHRGVCICMELSQGIDGLLALWPVGHLMPACFADIGYCVVMSIHRSRLRYD